jgi:outer membrane receptor protein involved in Fe transport
MDADLTYALGGFSVTGQVHFLTDGKYDVTMVGPEDEGYSPFLRNSINTNRVSGRTYFNLSGSYQFGDAVQVYGAVVNLANTRPPVAPSITGSFNPVLYDVIGRTFRVGARMNF